MKPGRDISLFTAGCAILAGCLANVPSQAQIQEQHGATASVVAADNAFGLKFYQQILKEGPNKNSLISPVSVALALQMTYNGAHGATQTAMADALQLRTIDLNALNGANRAILTGLNSSASGATLHIANSLWVSKNGTIKPEFVAANHKFYQAEIGDLAGAPQNVNAWVDKQTNGKIKNILNGNDVQKGASAAILANAVYFKGAWLHPFVAEATKDEDFTLASGSKSMCKMMSTTNQFGYYKGNHFEAVSLPYGERGQSHTEMILFRPDDRTSLAAFQAQLTPANWIAWMEGLSFARGTIDLPRFRFEFDADLQSPLSALGMGVAFTNRADFSQMSREPLHIGRVKHKTYINVDEKGTEAAAATVVIMTRTAMRPTRPFHVTFNKPFVCAIRSQETGAILFLGTVTDPMQK